MKSSNVPRSLLALALSFMIPLAGCFAWMAPDTPDGEGAHRDWMRDLVVAIGVQARGQVLGFLIIPQNGEALLTTDGTPEGPLAEAYLSAIDGFGREDLLYGYEEDDRPTRTSVREEMSALLDLAENNGIDVLVTDYCSTQAYVDASYAENAARGYISFAAPSRELDVIPQYPPRPFNENNNDVSSLADAANLLYLINPARFSDRASFLNALQATDYDLLIVDLFCEDDPLTSDEVASLKVKANGGTRLVLCYLSIGEAEDYRSYWQPEWHTHPPDWLGPENPDWPGNYTVRYWNSDWQEIVFRYLDRILAAGFDGAYLDRIDVYETFEE